MNNHTYEWTKKSARPVNNFATRKSNNTHDKENNVVAELPITTEALSEDSGLLSPRNTNKTKNTNYSWHWDALPELILVNMDDGKNDNLSNEFLFIVKSGQVINVFETISEFTLAKSYNHNNNESYLSIINSNYISTAPNSNMRCIYENNKNNINIDDVNAKQYTKYNNYTHIVSCDTNSKIDLYIYKIDNKYPTIKTSYSTFGDLFIYNCGIISTQIIYMFDNNLKKPVGIDSTIDNTQYNEAVETDANKIAHNIQNFIVKNTHIFKINEIANEQFSIDIYNSLYIKIYPLLNNKLTYNEYVTLLKYIDYFYWYKFKLNINDYELKKDYQYNKNNNTTFENFKQKYSSVIEYAPLSMHIFDYLYLMAFIYNKIPHNDFLIKLCSILYRKWVSSFPSNKINLSTPKPISNKLSIYTYIILNNKNTYKLTKENNYVKLDENGKYIFGKFDGIYENNVGVKSNFNNSFVFWFGNYNDKNNTVNTIYTEQNYTVYNIVTDYNTEYKHIVDYINKSNKYYISEDLININCIDEYCNSKIGCFNYDIKDYNPAWMNNVNNYTNIIIVGYINNTYARDDNIIYNIEDTTGNKSRKIGATFYDYKNDKNNTTKTIETNIRTISPKNKYVNLNNIKSIIYDKDVYIANSYVNKESHQYTPVEIYNNKLFSLEENIRTKLRIKNNEQKYFTPLDVEYINIELKKIDDANKQTPIGILEMVDSISKFGRVNTFCKR